jgi:ankyrin repeat protein
VKNAIQNLSFDDAVHGLLAGDFSRLAPLFENTRGSPSQIIEWHQAGLFANEPRALDEALTCACFNGCTDVITYLLETGVKPSGGQSTGLNALHWAANRGQREAIRILLRHNAPLEVFNSYGGTVLGCAVWSAIHEPRPHQVEIIEELLKAGANVVAAEYPTGNERVDTLLRSYGAGR